VRHENIISIRNKEIIKRKVEKESNKNQNMDGGVQSVASNRWDIQPSMGQAKTTDGTAPQWFPEWSVLERSQ
jgi:hypothetical protein